MKKISKLRFSHFSLLLVTLSLLTYTVNAQEVSGTVTDAEDETTLPGVNIVAKGTDIGTTTNTDGMYSINVPSLTDTLVFSFVGYETVEVPINGRTNIDIQLTPGVILGEDIIVVGFGTQRRENLTGSVGTIQGTDLSEQPSINTSSALMGKSAGVQVVQNSGQPGADGGTVRIRGTGTLGNSDPLILIDGVEGNLNDVASSDIENISVLKDASSAAIYGSRAANGVILVTTKRGQTEEFQVNYKGFVGWQSSTNQPEFTDAGTYMRLENLGATNLGAQPIWSEEYIQEWEQNHPSDEYPNTDWVDAVFTEPAIQQQQHLSISGGNESVRYLSSLQYDEQNGEIVNFGFRRYNIRLNTDVTVSEKLSFNFDANAIRKDQTEPSAGLSNITRQAYRLGAIYDDRFDNGEVAPGGLGDNPVADAHLSGLTTNETGIFRGRLQGQFEPIAGLELKLMYAPEFRSTFFKSMRKQWQSIDPESGDVLLQSPDRNSLLQAYRRDFTNNANFTIHYQHDIEEHGFEFLGGYELIDFRNDTLDAFRDNFPLQEFEVLSAGSQGNQQNFGTASEYTLQSFFGRINYEFKGKYLLEGNLRYDGSSRFSEGNKWGVFPSFSVGWRISEEAFMDEYDFISEMKLRGSWGVLGNQEIGVYPSVAVVDLGQPYIFGGQSVTGAGQLALANENITWEETSTTNIGLDLALLSNRLNFTFDWFKRTTDDILLELPVPLIIGMSAPFQNAGQVENQGWELSIGYRDNIGSDFSYDLSFNVSDVDNKVTDLRGAGPFIEGNSIIQVGDPINAIYGWESDGLFDTQQEIDNHATQFGQVAPGDIRYIDQNDDGIINAQDRKVIGDPFPSLNYGININANYKNFDLRVFFQGVGSRDVLLQNDIIYAFHNGGNIQQWQADSYWTSESPDDDFPRLTQATDHNNFRASDYWMYDASYLRLRNLQIGYTIPTEWSSSVSARSIRVYFLGQNLWTGFDNLPPGVDPNVPNNTIGSIYPVQKLYSFGVDINF